MFVSYDSSFEQKTGQQRWFNTSDVASLTIFPEDGGIIGVVGVSVSSPPLTGGIEGTSGSCGVLGSLGTIPVALYCA